MIKTKTNDLFKNLLCKPDFLIKDVESKDIKDILNDPNKKYKSNKF